MGEPPVIKKLDQVVVNRIAAGEVIQRPANALKELIENSLDAKSTNIQITVKNGGLKFLQIQDNGTGIRREDFEIVCERFTTSKLREFQDLLNISTYGFRGEALASISHVAHLTILSKTSQEKCAHKATYEDGKVKGDIKPTAGNQGTQITVEDLFYNMNVRRNVLRSPVEEYQKIADIVGKYAIHNSSVGFGLKKFGANNDIRTPPSSNTVDNIRTIYGNDISRELLELELEDEELKFTMNAYISNVNYSKKNFVFILFINHRLVDCQGLKKSIDEVYTNYLPKNMHPFVYTSLVLDPHSVDVNVHPTKHEVHFMYEEKIIDRVIRAVETKLLGCNTSRTFYTQAKLPGFNVENATFNETKSKSSNSKQQQTTYDKDLVRTNAQEQKLDKFFGAPVSKTIEERTEDKRKSCEIVEEKIICSAGDNSQREQFNSAIALYDDLKRTELTTVLQLCQSIEDDCHRGLRNVFAQHVWVGAINSKQSAIQHNTQLYICNTSKLVEELFYEIVLYFFGNFALIKFTHDLPIYDLTLSALDLAEAGWTEEDGPKEELAEKVCEILQSKAMLMQDYFSVTISEEGHLKTLPLLLENHVPQIEFLPMYILRLATEVNWDEEKDCFRTFARETAIFYSKMFENDPQETMYKWKWTTEHVLYPNLKKYFLPPKSFAQNGYVLEVANLPNLYKVFERC